MRTLEWLKRPVTPSRTGVPSCSVTPSPCRSQPHAQLCLSESCDRSSGRAGKLEPQ